ncbi:MAG: hypothetical protein DELT_00520 [Desulfovibrio sp.]
MSSQNIPHPVVTAVNGAVTHVMVPIDEYLSAFGEKDKRPSGYTFVPHKVANLVLAGESPLRAWRKQLELTQEEAASRMGVTRPAYAQMEKNGTKPQRATLEKASEAFGIDLAQLVELYDDETVSAPAGVAKA